MTLDQYVAKLNTLYQTGNAREHSYRGDLQNLIMAIIPDVLVTNEPARVACGAPDYVLTRKDVPLGYIEAKDIGVDLKSKTLKEQFDRYKNGLSNLIFTDYLDFHFYRDGEFVTSIAIATIENGNIVGQPQHYSQFTTLIINFAQTISQTIKSPTKLAQMMAGKARLMADVIEKTLGNDDEQNHVSALKGQMLTFKQMLIHDIDNKSFSDIYSQTIAYGMFAARYHDPSLPTFSRQEAASLIPRSNPFLRKLFQDIAGYDLDHRLVWIVDDLVSIFLASDVATIMKNFGKSTKQEDPVVHFYETFLGEYNPALRKARGVWYTPQPVVNFIVRAVDEVLKTEFGLKDGLADTSKTKIKVKVPKFDDRSKTKSIITGEQEIEKEVHRVQVLDPATGTGTFLAEVVKHIYKKFEGQQGIWSNYVKNDLIPRLNGFELLMASYAMAHLKMDMLLTETGYTPTDDQRLKIFLTNSLEEASDQQLDLFNWLADEANQANAVKKEAPVMVVIGNPPYSGESANKGEWIMNLMEDYKKEPGGKEKLKEQNSKFINDDYVKFIRFGQHFIEKNGEGILAFINPHGFLDNPTFRGMRWNLLKTYDKIYTIDLHGNSKKNETAEDGSVDQNVFDIMQGVSINIMVKTGKKKTDELGQVYHYDLYGKRDYKYNFLAENSIKTIGYQKLENVAPNYFMVQKNFEQQGKYECGFALNTVFNINSLGLLTKKDKFITDFESINIKKRLNDFINLENSDDFLSKKYNLKLKDNDKWNLNKSRNELIKYGIIESNFKIQNYRCFDKRSIYYDNNFVARLNTKVLNHLASKNYSLISTRQLADNNFRHIFISNIISDQCFISNKTKEGCQVFPLYLYPDSNGQHNAFEVEQQERIPNLDATIAQQIAKGIGATYVPELDDLDYGLPPVGWDPELEIGPLAILDYIYAVLHSPNYREKYKEFLKIDFPRVPYPTDRKAFWALVALGTELRQLHLLESDTVEQYITTYPIDGDNVVVKPGFDNGKVFINDTQYFDGVPVVAWSFYIGGYQPAQKWLKDRKGRTLTYEDIFHYQKMIVAMTETSRIMTAIDAVRV